jgi:hypothetical protein
MFTASRALPLITTPPLPTASQSTLGTLCLLSHALQDYLLSLKQFSTKVATKFFSHH